MRYNKNKRKLFAEINIVPYVDVTLVLLVVFMVAAPLLIQGVNVDLPQAISSPLETNKEEPLIVSIKSNGNLYINLGSKKEITITKLDLFDRVSKILKQNPNKSVLVWGDKKIPYGEIVKLMVLLQEAGANSIGLVTENPQD